MSPEAPPSCRHLHIHGSRVEVGDVEVCIVVIIVVVVVIPVIVVAVDVLCDVNGSIDQGED